MNNQPKNVTFKYEKEERLCLGIENIFTLGGKTTRNNCPVFDYTGKKISTIDAYKK